jgi:hypothetical protein
MRSLRIWGGAHTDETRARPAATANVGAAPRRGRSIKFGRMKTSLTMAQKLGFVDAFLRVLSDRAPDVARPFNEVMTSVRARPTQSKVSSVYVDLLEWCRYLPAPDRREISGILQSSMGRPQDYFDAKRLERIAKIVQRGFLRSDDEWRFVEERIQELSDLDESRENVLILDGMLRAYEVKKKKKQNKTPQTTRASGPRV